MLCRRRVCAAITVAVAFSVSLGWPGGISRADEDTSHVMVFSGREIWRNGAFTHGGMLFAPGGFERDGLMLKLMTSGGAYRYWPGSMPGEQVTGVEWQTQVLPGFRIKRGDAEIKIFMGAECRATGCGLTIRPTGCADAHSACGS